jgi:hypothetical protein
MVRVFFGSRLNRVEMGLLMGRIRLRRAIVYLPNEKMGRVRRAAAGMDRAEDGNG